MKTINDIIESISEKVSIPHYYEFNTWEAICNNLSTSAKDKSNDGKKFPMIMLHSGIKGTNDEIYTNSDISLFFVAESKPEWTPEERDQKTYKNVLYPLFDEMLSKMFWSNYLFWKCGRVESIPYTFSHYYYSGKSEDNKLNRVIDALEIKLSIKIKKC